MERLELHEQFGAYQAIRSCDAIGLIKDVLEEAVRRGDVAPGADLEDARVELLSLEESVDNQLRYFRRRAGLED